MSRTVAIYTWPHDNGSNAYGVEYSHRLTEARAVVRAYLEDPDEHEVLGGRIEISRFHVRLTAEMAAAMLSHEGFAVDDGEVVEAWERVRCRRCDECRAEVAEDDPGPCLSPRSRRVRT